MALAVLSRALSFGLQPVNILDLGSGTGAVSLAIDLLLRYGYIRIVSVEPSETMTAFAKMTPLDKRIVRKFIKGRIEDALLQRNQFAGERFQLIVMSACLPQIHDSISIQWSQIAQHLAALTSRGAKLILIEPHSKRHQTNLLVSSLATAGWEEINCDCCHNVQSHLMRRVGMLHLNQCMQRMYPEIVNSTKMTHHGLKLIGHPDRGGAFPITTWNGFQDYRESIHILVRN